jgi:phytol kinase
VFQTSVFSPRWKWLATALSVLALWVRDRWPHHREWSRKLVHIGAGPVVLIAWWLGIDRTIALSAAATVTVIAALNHRFRLLPAVEDVDRHSYGTVAYGASFTLLLWLWWERGSAWRAALAGLAVGFAPLVRYSDALVAVPAAAVTVWKAGVSGSAATERVRLLAAVDVPSAAAIV